MTKATRLSANADVARQSQRKRKAIERRTAFPKQWRYSSQGSGEEQMERRAGQEDRPSLEAETFEFALSEPKAFSP
jgi:hypothetical protein